MARWLCKQEPDCYSYDALERDGEAVWDGVTNALARRHLRSMQVGDHVFFYHTGKEKAVVGEMEVIRGPEDDPDSDDDKAVIVTVKPVRKFAAAVTLAQIKQDTLLAQWDLVRLPRLSVVPVTDAQWKRVVELGSGKGRAGKK